MIDTSEAIAEPGMMDARPAREREAEAADRIRDEQEAAEAAALAAKVGLDHIPTIDEARELLTARRAEIRKAVMVEADRRDCCEVGTRKVCANLRLERPGSRENREYEVELNLKVRVSVTSYTEEGALHRLAERSVLSPEWVRSQLYGLKAEVTPLAVTHNGEPIDVSTIIKPKPEVTA